MRRRRGTIVLRGGGWVKSPDWHSFVRHVSIQALGRRALVVLSIAIIAHPRIGARGALTNPRAICNATASRRATALRHRGAVSWRRKPVQDVRHLRGKYRKGHNRTRAVPLVSASRARR